MKRTTVFIFFMICSLSLLFGNISSVKAYNFDPSVEVGDEIVYEYYSDIYDLELITHVMVNVTDITDVADNATVIEGILYGSVNGGDSFDAAEQGPMNLATLIDYSLNHSSPIDEGDFFVVPGHKIGTYVVEINAALSSGTATSIKNDYGIEITGSPDVNKTMVYNKDGIVTTYHRTDDEGIRNFDIYSINGRRYTIPGYPIIIIIGFMILGALGIYLIKFRKKS